MSRRFGATYEFYGWDHDALMRGRLKTILLYRGKTRRAPSVRKREHLRGTRDAAPKPWGDLVTDFRVTWQRRHVTDPWLSTRENVGIAYKCPQCNDKMNHLNPNRIPIPEQYRQRRLRDSIGGTAAIVAGIKAHQRHAGNACWTGWHWPNASDLVTWYGPDAEGRRDALLNSLPGRVSGLGSDGLRSRYGASLDKEDAPRTEIRPIDLHPR